MRTTPRLAAALVATLLLVWPFPAPADAPPGATRLRILTWNAGTLDPRALRLPDEALPRVADVIARQRPDVVLLQELAPGQPWRLVSALRARGLVFQASTCVVDPQHPDGQSVILTRGATPRPRLRRHLAMGWNAQAVEVAGATVVCVHAPSSGPDERALYFVQLESWLRRLPGPVLVAGDFNLGPRHGAGLAAVLPWLRRQDVATYARFRSRFEAETDVSPTTVYRLHLDHLLARGARIDAARRLNGRALPQDHDPLLVEVTLASPRRGFSQALDR